MTKAFTLTGLDTMEKKMLAIAARAPVKFGQQLRLEGEGIRILSIREYVPINLGTLKNSSRVHGPDFGFAASSIEVSITFGGAASAYALAIHEHPSSSSPPSWKGKVIKFNRQGGAQRGVKYLERPMKFRARGMSSRIAKGVMPL